MHRPFPRLFAACLLAGGLLAQQPPPPAAPASKPPYAGDHCSKPGSSATWRTDGTLLTWHGCPGHDGQAMPCPKSAPEAVATGLAVLASVQQLWVLDSAGVITICQLSSPPTPVQTIATGLTATPTAGPSALALDERNRLAFYVWTDFATGRSELRVAPLATADQPFHRQDVTPQTPAAHPITGLRIDAARQTLQLTDGQTTWSMRYHAEARSIAFESAPVLTESP
ncbi:MAG: hypothetical protein IPK26_12965 [Planctomycetes bacterium]|nr:hypothetical protein [Planctomycetota bacterium]